MGFNIEFNITALTWRRGATVWVYLKYRELVRTFRVVYREDEGNHRETLKDWKIQSST